MGGVDTYVGRRGKVVAIGFSGVCVCVCVCGLCFDGRTVSKVVTIQ